MLKFFNTLSHKKEIFKPLKKQVGLYTCGPTVYNYAHIGNLRTYVFEDILKRVLNYGGYKVNHIMNITDVGHLTSDGDVGEDKMEKGAKREGKSAWDIAKFYTKIFKTNLKDLNIEEPNTWCRATDHIPEQIKLVQTLIKKGYAYETTDGIYFDTTKIKDYGKLANLKKQKLQAGVRVEMGEKKNPHDFALWKWSPANEKRQMEWKAFSKMGFPGWHIECSAMSMKYLGKQFDIHCGGVDHIPVHHTNEIAQSEAATGKKPWVKYWLHGEFLNITNPSTGAQGKMAKSGENFITLQTLKTRNLNPLAYRYLLLQTHYRKQLMFSWEALGAANQGLEHLYEEAEKLRKLKTKLQKNKNTKKQKHSEIEQKFNKAINDDLNTPLALATIWEGLKNKQLDYQTLLKFDEVLGLELKNTKTRKHKKTKTLTTDKVQKLLDARTKARSEKNWTESDRLREEIKKLGFSVEDTAEGQKIMKHIT
jgi:cysteinyl-tRNA synthetase